MSELLYKRVQARLAFKTGGPEGSVQAIFSTFNVVDKDRDVVLPSAFTHGQQVPMVWSHDWTMPVGKGTILVEKDQAVFDGAFFLETQAGQEAYRTVKAMGDLQDWSWGFEVLESDYETRDGKPVRLIKRTETYEVSPVLVGAGQNTRTVAVKSEKLDAKKAIPYRETAKAPEGEDWSAPALSDFTDQAWDKLTSADKGSIAACFAYSASWPAEKFTDLALPHHRASDGAVVWNGVRGAASRFNQTDIAADAVTGVKAHLRAHYAQFEKEVPDVLKEATDDSKGSNFKPVFKATDFTAALALAASREALWQERYKIENALREALTSTLGDAEIDTAGKIAIIKLTAAEYSEALVAWAARALDLIDQGVLDTEEMTHSPTEEKEQRTGEPYSDEAKAALAAVEALVGRTRSLADLRAKEGRILSVANRERLAKLKETLGSVLGELEELLKATEPRAPDKGISPEYLEMRLRATALALRLSTLN